MSVVADAVRWAQEIMKAIAASLADNDDGLGSIRPEGEFDLQRRARFPARELFHEKRCFKLTAMLVLVAFVVERITAGVLFLFSFSATWKQHFPNPAAIA